MISLKRVLGIIIGIGSMSSVIAMPIDTLQTPTHSFTAQQAVDYALKNNVQVKNALLGGDDYILETFVTEDKLKTLIFELLFFQKKKLKNNFLRFLKKTNLKILKNFVNV